MTKNDINDDISELADIEALQAKKQKVLARLLDEVSVGKNKHIAIRGSMGLTLGGEGISAISIPAYSVMHTMNWVSTKENMGMGSEMPFMRTAIDPDTGKLIIDEESAEKLEQRAPDWTRQPSLTVYLLQQPYRKFGTILAVVSPDWVNDPEHENWGDDKRALKNSVTFRALDTSGNIGVLDLEGSRVYALDGQHRVMGIRGVSNVLNDGGLTIWKREGMPTSKKIARDALLSRLEISITDLQHILQEKINVEYIPAVMAGETREEASRRVRMVFVAINEYAKSPDKGENILLNESDGYSIVARRIGHHSIFKNDEGESRVNWKNKNLSASDHTSVMTLQHLREMCEAYGEAFELGWNDTEFRDTVPIRPNDNELNALEAKMKSILCELQGLRCFIDLNSGDALQKLRDFPTEEHPERRGHLLMRPIGLPIIIRAIAPVLKQDDKALDKLIAKLKKLDLSGGFEAHRAENLWYYVTYDPRKNKMIATTAAQKLASDLLRYLLIGASAEKRDMLTKRVVEARTIEEGSWVDFEGKSRAIQSLAEIHLPEPIKLD